MDKVRTYNIFTSPAEISKIIDLALKHLPPLGFECKLSFERTGKGTFDSEIIGAIANGPEHRITVNLDWYEMTNNKDLHYIIWHETRHLYQWAQIEKMHKGEPIQDDVSVIKEWEHNLRNYIYNTKETETAHMKQEMEIDAYSFAVYMLIHYFRDKYNNVNIGLPPMTADEIWDRAIKAAKSDYDIYKHIL